MEDVMEREDVRGVGECELMRNAIKVTVGGRTVEVCCDDCAQKLKEAYTSAATVRRAE
jgi:hypothetical protein